MTVYKGACHCGRVKFSVDVDVEQTTLCNCSICDMKGAVYAIAKPSSLVFECGEEVLQTYQFGTEVAKHHFCRHCGIHVLTRPRIDPRLWAVNLRCLDVDIAQLKPYLFDGKNWRAAAKKLISNNHT